MPSQAVPSHSAAGHERRGGCQWKGAHPIASEADRSPPGPGRDALRYQLETASGTLSRYHASDGRGRTPSGVLSSVLVGCCIIIRVLLSARKY